MHYDLKIKIDATPTIVWLVLSDVERWPRWTGSVRSIELLDRPFGAGAHVRIRQPKLPPVVWKVTDFEPGRAFTWESRSIGATAIARHTIIDNGDGSSTAVLSITQRGPVGSLVGAIARRLTKRYVAFEAEGLKAASESLRARPRTAP